MKLTLTENLEVIDVESVSKRCLGYFKDNGGAGYTFKPARLYGLPMRLSEQEEIEVSYLQLELEG